MRHRFSLKLSMLVLIFETVLKKNVSFCVALIEWQLHLFCVTGTILVWSGSLQVSTHMRLVLVKSKFLLLHFCDHNCRIDTRLVVP